MRSPAAATGGTATGGGGAAASGQAAREGRTSISEQTGEVEPLKNSIMALEKSFKETMQIRRIQNQPLATFHSDNTIHDSPSGETVEELIMRAKSELFRDQTAKVKLQETKKKDEKAAEAILQWKVEQTKRRFMEKQACIQAGPNFLFNFTSCFGDVVHVEPIFDQYTFAVFGTKGRIEMWRYLKPESADGSGDAELFDILNIGTEGLACVVKIYEDRPTFSSDSSMSVTFNLDAAPAEDRPQQISRPTTTDSEGANAKLKKKGIAHGGPVQSQADLKVVENPSASEDDLDPFHAFGFFLGFNDGEGIVVELRVSRSGRVDYFKTVSRKRLSLTPIKLCTVAEFDDVIVTVVSLNGVDQVIVALYADLETAWQCKSEIVKSVVRDKQTRSVPESATFDNVQATPQSQFQKLSFDESITAVATDYIHKRVLVALKSGTVVSVTGEMSRAGQVDTPSGRRTTPKSAPEATQDSYLHRVLFASWCFDAIRQASKATYDFGVESKIGRTTSASDGRPQSMSESLISINHLLPFVNGDSRSPQCIVGCIDGSLRVYNLNPPALRTLGHGVGGTVGSLLPSESATFPVHIFPS
ncbi:hypothetical protein DFJ73DRAFT_327680 [Zopfochytrium polystomum]|nr:hypothetical protein DFJ73DRAFT_327680 [Zopfochytrium polystomum]